MRILPKKFIKYPEGTDFHILWDGGLNNFYLDLKE